VDRALGGQGIAFAHALASAMALAPLNNMQQLTGQSNGIHEVWLDNQKVYAKYDVIYRTSAAVKIDKFTFRNFHGGKSDAFRPGQTQYNWCAFP
jgi:hypothetical protein